MVEEKISQKFGLKTINETRNYFIEEVKENELMIKKVSTTLNYIAHFLILVSTFTGCISVFAFASWVIFL